jgi:hypothetical protein
VDLERPALVPALGVALAAAGTFLLIGSIGGLSLHQTGWIVAALGLAALVLCGILIGTSGAEPEGDAKLAALVGALALPAGVALASFGGSNPFSGGRIPVGILLQPLAFLAGGASADAASDGLLAGAVALFVVYLWTRWPRLAFAAGIEAVLGLSERLVSGVGDGSWIRGLILLGIAAALTFAVMTLRSSQGDLSSSLAVPAGIAALIGAVLLPIADPGRLALGSLVVAAPLLVWALWLLVLAPRLGAALVAVVATFLLAFDLADGSHVWIAILVLTAGALLALTPLAQPQRLRS